MKEQKERGDNLQTKVNMNIQGIQDILKKMKKDREELPEFIKFQTKHMDDKLLLVLSSLDDVQTKIAQGHVVSNVESNQVVSSVPESPVEKAPETKVEQPAPAAPTGEPEIPFHYDAETT